MGYISIMPHTRARHLASLLRKSMSYSPITGVFGHRQVGKTTLVSALAEKYVTLDVPTELANAQASPEVFLSKNAAMPLVIDECQYAPNLFPVLKEWVRTRKKPGQFLLTGSVRFSSRKVIRESLTGRMIAWELLPMDWSEQHSMELPDGALRLLKDIRTPLMKVASDINLKKFSQFIEMGGLPGVFVVRSSEVRKQRFETQMNTLLERDLKLVLQTSLGFSTLRKMLVALAIQAGGPLDYTALQKASRVSLPTLKKLVSALESLFIIRLYPCEGDYKKSIVRFEDIGEQNYLARMDLESTEALTAFLYHNLRVQFHYRPDSEVEMFTYRTRRGFDVPICLRQGKKVLGIIPVVKNDVEHAYLSAKKFVEAYDHASAVLVSLGPPLKDYLGDRIRHLSIAQLLLG